MLDVIAKLVTAVISPLGTALFAGILALVLNVIGRRRLAFGLSSFALAWLYAWSLPLASVWLREIVEGKPVDALVEGIPSAQAIVVLGGGIGSPQMPEARPNLGSAADRVWYAATLYHAGKAPLIVISGGSAEGISMMSEAEATLWLLKDLGVPESAVLIESQSRTTQQNASFTGAILKERGIDHILLVTSALHMNRAIANFQTGGLAITPAPTDYEAQKAEMWQSWIPNTDALDGSARAMKEIVGLIVGR